MTATTDLQERVARALQEPGALPGSAPVLCYRPKEARGEMEAALAARGGSCIYVLPPVPTHAMQGTPFLFFDGMEVRVQIVEIPRAKAAGEPDLYDLVEAVALALHWQPKSAESPLSGILAHPLAIAERPAEVAEGLIAVPGFEHDGKIVRAADVIFNAVIQINNQ